MHTLDLLGFIPHKQSVGHTALKIRLLSATLEDFGTQSKEEQMNYAKISLQMSFDKNCQAILQ